jgi:hypothetical protein
MVSGPFLCPDTGENTMADEGDNGAPDDGDAEDNDAQQLLADAASQDSGDNGMGSDTDKGPDTRTAAELTRLKTDLEKWKSLARRHEGRAKENAQAAAKAKSVEEQIEELRSQLAERDVADVERNGRLAMTQVHAALAEAGIKKSDVEGLLELVDPTTLLTDGEPNEKAINKLAASLTKVAGKVTPDRDQGRKGGNAPPNMNDIIRRAAGIRIN